MQYMDPNVVSYSVGSSEREQYGQWEHPQDTAGTWGSERQWQQRAEPEAKLESNAISYNDEA
eukprot:506382-Pyramimonas_sp.AAC.1